MYTQFPCFAPSGARAVSDDIAAVRKRCSTLAEPTLRGGCGGCCGENLDEHVLKDVEQENERQKQEKSLEAVKDAQPSPTDDMKQSQNPDGQESPQDHAGVDA